MLTLLSSSADVCDPFIDGALPFRAEIGASLQGAVFKPAARVLKAMVLA